eukprot:5595089-Prymnesium_polylepis.1
MPSARLADTKRHAPRIRPCSLRARISRRFAADMERCGAGGRRVRVAVLLCRIAHANMVNRVPRASVDRSVRVSVE